MQFDFDSDISNSAKAAMKLLGSVDCRLCLNLKTRIAVQSEAEERAIVEQMGDMAEFMKRQERP